MTTCGIPVPATCNILGDPGPDGAWVAGPPDPDESPLITVLPGGRPEQAADAVALMLLSDPDED